MRTLIIGAGNAGEQLATRLCMEKHDVVLIDENKQALEVVDAQLDVLTILGNGSNPRILAEAGIEKTDLIVTLTNSDETNILACLLASNQGVKYKIARILNGDYAKKTNTFNLQNMGIDLLVSQQEECAMELFNMLRIPGAQEVVDLMDGRALCIGFKLPTNSPLLLTRLADFPEPERLETIRFIALQRGKITEIPTGETQFNIGDDIYMAGSPNHIRDFLAYASPDETSFGRVVIVGGSPLGLSLARKLKSSGMDIVLVEMNDKKAEECSDELENTLVIKGNALHQETLEDIGMQANTAFVATTANDENNIMSCLVAEKLGAQFTTARINNPDYIPIVNSLSLLDRAVSPHTSLINAIYHFVRGQHVHADSTLQKIPGEILEIHLGPNHPWLENEIKNINMPKSTIIAMVMRDNEAMVATGDLKLKLNDHLAIFTLPEGMKKLNALLT